MNHYIDIPAGIVVPFGFDTFLLSGASGTISGFAVTDIEIYKGTSMVQRASDNGYALLDTDGVDLDGITGIQGCSIDFGDNSDAGFYAVGSYYRIVVSIITIDGLSISFTLAWVRIVAAENNTGTPVVDLGRWRGSVPALLTVDLVNVDVHAALGTTVVSSQGYFGVDVKRWDAATVDSAIGGTPQVYVAGMGNNVMTAAAAAADLTTELQSGLATSAMLTLVKAKTDQLTFTVANQVDANALTGGGGSSPWDALRASHVTAGTFGEYVNANLSKILGNTFGLGDLSFTIIGGALNEGEHLPLLIATVYSAANANLVTISGTGIDWDAAADSAYLTIRYNHNGRYVCRRVAATTYAPASYYATFAIDTTNYSSDPTIAVEIGKNYSYVLELKYGSVYTPILIGKSTLGDPIR